MVISRYLTPEDVAIGGLALVAMGLFQVFAVQGFAQALVRAPGLTPLTVHSVFWPILGAAAVVAPLALSLSGVLADYYDEPALRNLMPWLVVGLVASMLAAIPTALLQREMKFFHLNTLLAASGLTGAVLGIVLAVQGHGYYAMIIPMVAGHAMTAVGSFVVTGYLPAFRFSRTEFRKVRLFGFSQLGSNIIRYMNNNGDYIVMSRYWPKASFGQYYFAFERSRLPFNLLYMQLSSALFPSFSHIQNDSTRLRRGYLAVTEGFTLIMFPLYVGVIGLADPLVPWIFGTQWEPAVPVFQIFAAFTFVRAFAVPVPPMLYALNLAHWDLLFNIIRFVVIIPALFVLGHSNASIVTTAWVLLGIWSIQAPIYIWMLLCRIELSPKTVLTHIRKILGGTVVMLGTLIGGRTLLTHLGAGIWLELIVASIVATVVYAYLVRHTLLGFLRRVYRSIMGHERSPVPPAVAAPEDPSSLR